MKKVISLLLAVLMLMSVVAVPASAYDEDIVARAKRVNNWAFETDVFYRDRVNIVGYTGKESIVTVPEYIEYRGQKYKVSEIGYRTFADDKNLVKVTFPEGITRINPNALQGSSVKYIRFYATTEVAQSAFFGCVSLEKIHVFNNDSSVDIDKMLPDLYYKDEKHVCEWREKIDSTCEEIGYEAGWYCPKCDWYEEGGIVISPSCKDKNYDGKCDTCSDKTCDHICHESGFLGFIWSIGKFFCKLFKTNPVCECGAAHY